MADVLGTGMPVAPPLHSFSSSPGIQFVRHNSQKLSRIYPSGQRLQSSNYNPQDMWNGGCQIGKGPFPPKDRS